MKNNHCEFSKIRAIINQICLENFKDIKPVVEKCDVLPPAPKFADKFEFAANHAMILASFIKENPRDVAEKLINYIKNHEIHSKILHIEAVASFINIKMKPEFWQEFLPKIIENSHYGFENYGKGEKVNVEYVSANPTGPMHIGHARGAIYGDVISNLLEKCGYNVTREYYINDGGAQIKSVLDSVLFRAKQVIINDFSANVPENCYPGEYIIPIARAVIEKFGQSITENANSHEIIVDFVINYTLDIIKEDLQKLGVFHSIFTSEKKITRDGKVDLAVKLLEEKGLIYKGVLEKPKGNETQDWEAAEQMLFASSKFGDDTDRAIRKNDGSWAYFTPDIAYHYDKYQRGFNKMILVLGADHKGYKKRISAAVNAISDGRAGVEVVLCELVNFLKNGTPMKMSKRAGNFLSLADVLEEIDPQILRFFIITKKNDTVVDFDFAKVMEQSKDNPVFYIQYAYSRCCSLARKVEFNLENLANYDDLASLLSHPAQIAIIHKLAQYPRTIQHCVANLSPHLITSYLFELAGMFHAMWNISDFRFISDDHTQTNANMILVNAVKSTIKSALDCLGVSPMERM